MYAPEGNSNLELLRDMAAKLLQPHSHPKQLYITLATLMPSCYSPH